MSQAFLFIYYMRKNQQEIEIEKMHKKNMKLIVDTADATEKL